MNRLRNGPAGQVQAVAVGLGVIQNRTRLFSSATIRCPCSEARHNRNTLAVCCKVHLFVIRVPVSGLESVTPGTHSHCRQCCHHKRGLKVTTTRTFLRGQVHRLVSWNQSAVELKIYSSELLLVLLVERVNSEKITIYLSFFCWVPKSGAQVRRNMLLTTSVISGSEFAWSLRATHWLKKNLAAAGKQIRV